MRTSAPRNEIKVRRVLEQFGPRTIPDLAKRTGLAYNTVKTALERMKASPIEGSYPAKWQLDGKPSAEIETATVRIGKKQDLDVTVSISTHADWIDRWNAARKTFGQSVMMMAIDHDSDPAKLSAEFAAGASSFAGLAFAIQQVQDRPDWYELLSGDSGMLSTEESNTERLDESNGNDEEAAE